MGKQKAKNNPESQRYIEFSSHELCRQVQGQFKIPCIDISTFDTDSLSVLLPKISTLNSSFFISKNISNRHMPIFSDTVGW
jgi:hypothetical protein